MARQELQQELVQQTLYSRVLKIVDEKARSRKEISTALNQRSISGQLNVIINSLLDHGLIEWTIPDVPHSPKQQYRITRKEQGGLDLLK